MAKTSSASRRPECVIFLCDVLEILEEILNILQKVEKNFDRKTFLLLILAYCFMIREQVDRAHANFTPSNGTDDIAISQLLDWLGSLINPDLFLRIPAPPSPSTRLNALVDHWPGIPRRLDFIARIVDFGTTTEERNNVMQKLVSHKDNIERRYPNQGAELHDDRLARKEETASPSSVVWKAAKSMFEALVACKQCSCHPMGSFGARLRFGTHGRPGATCANDSKRDPQVDDPLYFDMFLSMKHDWYKTRIRADDEARCQYSCGQPEISNKRERRATVKKLCEPIDKISKMESYRLELQVSQSKLFKLKSGKLNTPFGTQNVPISLEEYLRSMQGCGGFTERARRELAVLLSYAVLHLNETPWLSAKWNSSGVLFFQNDSSAIPLQPYIQIELPTSDKSASRQTRIVIASKEPDMGRGRHDSMEPQQTGPHNAIGSDDIGPGNIDSDDIDPDDVGSDDTDPDEFDSDEVDPDDILEHQCPILISLAVMILEIYFAAPFEEIAKQCGVKLSTSEDSSIGTKFLEVDLVYQECRKRGDMPDNTQYPTCVVDKCLDSKLWEDEDQGQLETQVLRHRIYQMIVQPLESELTQAFTDISIDKLDDLAAQRNISRWNRPIDAIDNRCYPQKLIGSLPSLPLHGGMGALTHPKSTYSRSEATDTRHLRYDPTSHPTTGIRHTSCKSKFEHVETDYKRSKFFDDEVDTDSMTARACSQYYAWSSAYVKVYEKFLPSDLHLSAAKIAILDTGIDKTHPDIEARAENIKDTLNWVDENSNRNVNDTQGHGTFTASLALDFAPDAYLYIAKIAEKEPSSPRAIANAVTYAVSEWDVDIISMSFGFPTCDIEDYDKIEEALKYAHSKNVLVFAAASNNGGGLGRSFPAREPTVIAVHSTDTYGNRSKFSPTAAEDEMNFATVGEAVTSAWPLSLSKGSSNTECKSGTSYATPIMAGIAGFLLMYGRTFLGLDAPALKKQKVMKALLKRIAKKSDAHVPRDDYYFVDLSLYSDSAFGLNETHLQEVIRDLARKT